MSLNNIGHLEGRRAKFGGIDRQLFSGNASGGAGAFWGGAQGANVGAFVAAGAVAGGGESGYCAPPATEGETNGIAGAYAGGGIGFFVTNATSVSEVAGAFSAYNVSVGYLFSVGVQYEFSGSTWLLAVSFGPGWGLSVSGYPTFTWTTN